MAIYHYKQGSLISETQILANDSGGRRAYLFARADATAEQLEQVKTRVAHLGWKAVPYLHEGRPALEIRGFKKPEVLEKELRANGWVVEPASIETVDNDRRTAKEKFSNATLKIAGLSYIAGDVGYMYYAIKKYLMNKEAGKTGHRSADKIDIAAGIGYGVGSVALALYGSRDQSQNTIQTASKKVDRYLRQQALETKEGDTLHAYVQEPPRSLWGKVNHLLAKYPSEVLNSVYVFVGAALIVVGVKSVKQAKTVEQFATEIVETGLGVTTASSALLGLAVKEKKPIEGEEKRTGFGGFVDWVQEKPLRATGYGFMLATAFHGVGTVVKRLQGNEIIKKTIWGRGVFVAANIFSEVMLTFSSKGHGNGVKPDSSIDATVVAAVADTIAQQPVDAQPALINNLAGYLASSDVLGGKAEDHAEVLRKQVEALRKNPWSGHYKASAETSQAAVANVPNHKPAKTLPGTKIEGAKHAAMLQAPAQQAVAHS